MNFKEYVSKNTSVKVISVLGSQCFFTGTKITTLVLEYPRAIHAQLLTHRVFSKNSSSTRAVPLPAAIKQVKENPAKYIWTQNQKGMQGPVITDPYKLANIESAYQLGLDQACRLAMLMGFPEKDGGYNVHKQNAGRFLEPFQNIRVCLTSTEWENWDWLRIDGAAQGEITELANLVKQARDELLYTTIKFGEWHLPFVPRAWDADDNMYYQDPETHKVITLDEALNISMSVCAQTSYRKADASLEKAEDMKVKLFNGNKVHASPSEHQATPMSDRAFVDNGDLRFVLRTLPDGVTHIDRNGDCWSGNFKHWIQNRQLIPNHDKAKF